MRLSLGFPDRASERALLCAGFDPSFDSSLPRLAPEALQQLQHRCSAQHCSELLIDYVLDLVEVSRQWHPAPLAQSLHLLARRGVEPLQGESFPHLCQRAARMQPDLAPLFRPWRISSSCLPMPRSQHPSADSIHASGGNSAPGFADSVDLSACLLSWWRANGGGIPSRSLGCSIQPGVGLQRIISSILWHLDCRGDAAADPVGCCAPLLDALDGGVSDCRGPGRGVSGGGAPAVAGPRLATRGPPAA